MKPKKQRPGALAGATGAGTSQALNGAEVTTPSPQFQLATRYLARRYALRAAVALVIAAEIGLGGTQ